MLQQGVYRHLIGPVVGAEEYHRTGISETQVMVLYGILEDFLHGACTAGRVDDASLGNGEYAIFAQGVLEIFGDTTKWVRPDSQNGVRGIGLSRGKPCRATEGCRRREPRIVFGGPV